MKATSPLTVFLLTLISLVLTQTLFMVSKTKNFPSFDDKYNIDPPNGIGLFDEEQHWHSPLDPPQKKAFKTLDKSSLKLAESICATYTAQINKHLSTLEEKEQKEVLNHIKSESQFILDNEPISTPNRTYYLSYCIAHANNQLAQLEAP